MVSVEESKMIVRLVSMVGSFASLIALIFMIRPSGQPFTFTQGILLGFALLIGVVAIVSEGIAAYKRKPKSLKARSQIRDYMYRWITRGGRVAIFSRDLSWVQDEEMRELLRRKAKRNELCVCLPNEIPLVRELATEGAEVHTYPELEYVPESRFTIINHGRSDAQVAVGGTFKERHVIREFSVGEHPFFSVANDLVEVVARFSQWRESNKENREYATSD